MQTRQGRMHILERRHRIACIGEHLHRMVYLGEVFAATGKSFAKRGVAQRPKIDCIVRILRQQSQSALAQAFDRELPRNLGGVRRQPVEQDRLRANDDGDNRPQSIVQIKKYGFNVSHMYDGFQFAGIEQKERLGWISTAAHLSK